VSVYLPTGVSIPLESEQIYDAFPVVASNGAGVVVAMWYHSLSHVGNGASSVGGARSTDGGVTWANLGIVWDEPSPDVAASAAAVVWAPSFTGGSGQFVAYIQATDFTKNPLGRSGYLITSPDGVAWTRGNPVPMASTFNATWAFPSDLLWFNDNGTPVLLATAYGPIVGGKNWVPMALFSNDVGATWVNAGMPGGNNNVSNFSETKLAVGPSQVTAFIRNDDSFGGSTIWQSLWDATYFTWSSPVAVLQAASGQPSAIRTSTGAWLLTYRDESVPGVDTLHHPTGLADSDDGLSFVSRGDPTGTGRAMLYGNFAELPNGDVLLVYSVEDTGPANAKASVFVTTLRQSQIDARLVLGSNGPDLVRVHASGGSAYRNVVGTGTWDQVRYITDTDGALLDYEAPQGVPVRYALNAAGSGVTVGPVTLPESTLWLIDPNHPELSVPLDIPHDGAHAWTRASVMSSLTIPGNPRPHTKDFGRQDRAGSILAQVFAQDDYSALSDLTDLKGAKYLSIPPSHWIIEKVNPWVMVGDVSEQAMSNSYSQVMWQITLPLVPTDRPDVIRSLPGSGWLDGPGPWREGSIAWAQP